MTSEKKYPPIYIVSGGKGMAGDILVESTLIQFPNNKIHVIIVPDIISEDDLKKAINKVVQTGGVIVHTLVDTVIRTKLRKLCKEKNVREIDLMGELSDYLSSLLNTEPARIPGLFRKKNQEYFDRISSIEFAMSYDDGLNSDKLKNADVVLTGVSRTGKTPLSIYMAMFGWKVANVPVVNGIAVPEDLFKVDPRRVFGLTISINQLINQRNIRMERLGNISNNSYNNPHDVREELDLAESIFRKGGFTIIDVTNKPIESSSNEIVRIITKRFPQYLRKKILE